MAARPRLLLADEPTGNLDEATGDEVLKLALDLVAATGCAFLMATHSLRLATKLDRQVTLTSGVLANIVRQAVLDISNARQPLAPTPGEFGHAVRWPCGRDGALERRAGAQPAGSQKL